jgi:hypothetical protein
MRTELTTTLNSLAGIHDGPDVFPVERRLNQFGLVTVDDLELLWQSRRAQQPRQDAIERQRGHIAALQFGFADSADETCSGDLDQDVHRRRLVGREDGKKGT